MKRDDLFAFDATRGLGEYPLCVARGVLMELAKNPSHAAHRRVNLSRHFQSLSVAEKCRWDREVRPYGGDGYGYFPEPFEEFYQTLIDEGLASISPLPLEDVMPTAKELTAPKRTRNSRKAKAKNGGGEQPSDGGATATVGATIAASKNGDDPNQTYIEGTVDEPIPAMDRDLKKLAKARADISNLKDEESRLLTCVARRMHEHKLQQYKGAGYSVVIVPSAENVKVKPAKDK